MKKLVEIRGVSVPSSVIYTCLMSSLSGLASAIFRETGRFPHLSEYFGNLAAGSLIVGLLVSLALEIARADREGRL